MAKKLEQSSILFALQDLLIFEMARAEVPQSEIRKALGVDMGRVNRIARLVKKKKRASDE